VSERSLQVDSKRDDDGVERFIVVDVRDRRKGVRDAVPQTLATEQQTRRAIGQHTADSRRHHVPVSATQYTGVV